MNFWNGRKDHEKKKDDLGRSFNCWIYEGKRWGSSTIKTLYDSTALSFTFNSTVFVWGFIFWDERPRDVFRGSTLGLSTGKTYKEVVWGVPHGIVVVEMITLLGGEGRKKKKILKDSSLGLHWGPYLITKAFLVNFPNVNETRINLK